jgi:hypothetical protein
MNWPASNAASISPFKSRISTSSHARFGTASITAQEAAADTAYASGNEE